MSRFYVEITVKVTDVDDMEALFEPLADALYDLDGAVDADLGRSGDMFDFLLTMDAADEPAVLGDALTLVRTAVHATGGSTPGWETHFEPVRQTVRRESGLLPA